MKEVIEKLNIMNPGSAVAAVSAEIAAVPITVALLNDANSDHTEAVNHISDLRQDQYALTRTSDILASTDEPLTGSVVGAVEDQLQSTKKEIQVSQASMPEQIPVAEQAGILAGAMVLAAFASAAIMGQLQRRGHNRPNPRASKV